MLWVFIRWRRRIRNDIFWCESLRISQIFDENFGQIFDQIFGQLFHQGSVRAWQGEQEMQCTVLPDPRKKPTVSDTVGKL